MNQKQKNIILKSQNEHETYKIGFELLKSFSDKKLILLKGELGVGKTILAKGIGLFLNVQENIDSPTFNIKKSYNNVFFHYDLFLMSDKIKNNSNFLEMQIIEEMQQGFVVIEWANKLNFKKMNNYLFIEIKKMDEENSRKIIIKNIE